MDKAESQPVRRRGRGAVRLKRGRALGHPPRLDDDGRPIWGDGRWNVDELGFPNEDVELRARNGGRTWGRFMLTPAPGTAASLEARQVAMVLAGQAGFALAGWSAPHGSRSL